MKKAPTIPKPATSTEGRLRELLEDHGFDTEDVDSSACFTDDLQMDSLDYAEYILAVEDKFGLEEVDGDTFYGFTTFGQLVAYVDQHKTK